MEDRRVRLEPGRRDANKETEQGLRAAIEQRLAALGVSRVEAGVVDEIARRGWEIMLFGPGQKIIDMSVLKDFRFGDNHYVQFRAEAFNMPNTPSFGTPAANISVPASVGRITGTTVSARAIQFGLKLVY